MILEIHDLIENEKIKHVIDHEIDENGIIKYKLNGENYTLEVKDKEIIMTKDGEISYTNVYKKGKITKNFLKTSNLLLEIYIITRNISVKNGKIDLEYNIYNDSNALDLVSSYSINIEI